MNRGDSVRSAGDRLRLATITHKPATRPRAQRSRPVRAPLHPVRLYRRLGGCLGWQHCGAKRCLQYHGSGRNLVRSCGMSRWYMRVQFWIEVSLEPACIRIETYIGGPTPRRNWMLGVKLDELDEHSPSITGSSVEDTSVNRGFSLRKSSKKTFACSVCIDVQLKAPPVQRSRTK
jgi:hypothetical protein